ncbi:Fc.00g044520.m01.CDS01 [Cosmosporella sp. VM-42]
MERTGTPFEGFPLDVWKLVLASLPNLSSLRNAVLTCRTFHAAFTEYHQPCVAQVLINEIGIDVVPEAIAVQHLLNNPLDTTGTNSQRLVARQDFSDKYLKNRPLPPRRLKLRDALPLSRFHSYVEDFTEIFLRNSLKAAPDGFDQSIELQGLSRGETNRIHLSLYRFEIFRLMFGSWCPESMSDFIDTFFSHFPLWESAQLGCIHDFLALETATGASSKAGGVSYKPSSLIKTANRSIAFSDIAKHDIVWAAYGVSHDAGADSEYVQALLARGLERLLQIVSADTYEERYRLIVHEPEDPPARAQDFLYGVLETFGSFYEHDATGTTLLRSTPSANISGCEIGPQGVWQWPRNQNRVGIYDRISQPLRTWGYMLWDWTRLADLGIFNQRWDPAGREVRARIPHVSIGELSRPWDLRVEIYQAGGRGWWEEGDESKVVWPERGPVAPLIPESLEDAKKYWKNGLRDS